MAPKDVFFPTPYQPVIVWDEAYWVARLQGLPQKATPLPLEKRLACLSGVPIRWRVIRQLVIHQQVIRQQFEVQEGLALWNWGSGFRIPRSTRVETKRELLLPGELRIQDGNNGLVLTGPSIPNGKQALPRNILGKYLGQVVLVLQVVLQVPQIDPPVVIQANPPAVWAAGLYSSGRYESFIVRAIHPSGAFDVTAPSSTIDAQLVVAPRFLAVIGNAQLWAGGMDQNSLALLLEGKRLVGAGFSLRGHWLAALREDSETHQSWFLWRWAKESFGLVQQQEVAILPENRSRSSGSLWIAPNLKWGVWVESDVVWAIPLPPLSIGKKQKEHKETLRRIFPT